MIVELPDHPDATDPEPFAGPNHPMRKLTHAIALGEPWTDDDALRVAAIFDGLAPEWTERQVDPVKAAVVNDALDRGTPPFDGRWLELGSGTGAGTRLLHGRVSEQVSVDLSAGMLAHAPDGLAPKVRADSSRLPFAADTFDAILMINMILFPTEVDRVLRPGGAVVWVNTKGDQTPIHLPPDDVERALPGVWTGVTARAGTGLWAVLRRA
jgi:SAM-dependent methyltransferase